jgi:hypothetical protein
MKRTALIFILTVIVFTACSRRDYTEDEVRVFVVKGTTREAIIAKFGEPFADEKNPKFEDGSTKIDEIIYFTLPPPPPGVKQDFVFSGFQVRLKEGKAIEWFASHRSVQ